MSALTRVIISTIITVAIAIWGISTYSSGGSMGFPYPGGMIELSRGVFFGIMAGFLIFDIIQIVIYLKSVKPPPTVQDLKQPIKAEQLEAPCKVSITRGKSMWGAIESVHVNLNGYKIGELKNGGNLQFKTFLKENTITVVYDASLDSRSIEFEAEPEGYVQIDLNYRKGELTVRN